MRHLALVALTAVAAAATPALAQSLDEVVVTGRAYATPQSLSERVSYADLDLRLARDRAALLQRIHSTARRICDRLNEPSRAPSLGQSCEEIAVRGAQDQVRLAVADARSGPRYAANAAGAFAAPVSATAGNPNVVASAPVPDTRANRARYGAPLSHAGKRTAPAGN